MRVRHPDRI